MKTITYTNLLGEEITVGPKKTTNPLLGVFGKLEGDRKCKECIHLYRKHYSKVYIKCGLRPDTNGPGTDHRANWPACKKFVPKPYAFTVI